MGGGGWGAGPASSEISQTKVNTVLSHLYVESEKKKKKRNSQREELDLWLPQKTLDGQRTLRKQHREASGFLISNYVTKLQYQNYGIGIKPDT